MKRVRNNCKIENPMIERLVCAASYLTAGIVGLVWVIIHSILGKRISSFTRFNIYQSIFISVLSYIARIIFSILFNISQSIPLIGVLVSKIESAILENPVILTYSLLDFIVVVFLMYLVVFVLLGKDPLVPWISDTVKKIAG